MDNNSIYYRDKAVVLIYHNISNRINNCLSISPNKFESHLKELKNKKFNIIKLRQLLDAMAGKSKLPPNAVVITFDDGIKSFYSYAYPILKKYNMPAVNFIITSTTESIKSSSNKIQFLTPPEIKEMYKSGLVDIQSHTHDNHNLVYIDPYLNKKGSLAHRIYDEIKGYESEENYIKRIRYDLKKSREIIYKYIGEYPDVLSFPFGHFNNRVINISESCGFKYFITINEGVNQENSNSKIVLRIGHTFLNADKLIQKIIKVTKNNNT
ncbi:MAG: polysaccharide deacetylase family protein [Anaeromicrobium sp.]|jgi:biofilm PGA synthesis lipoprotein PgaB|uniref:polysaccharide deacetylase family protein n=1 Tax=Anaeromicrobium sp. TaxID=1929132 RepID=UPI0025DD57EE|nr:polysaccharide deacetylase family protein [Anaeromicrobium sp.]MCT4595008.1 polysaccharide deacetylase family protein [Anaeromicrobium sp.]